MKFISSLSEATANISRYREAAIDNTRLRDRAGYVRSWYARRNAAGAWEFGPSKFVGYQNPEDYLSEAGADGERDGRQTERLLGAWFTSVKPGSRLDGELRHALRSFLASFNQAPNARARISILNSDLDVPAHTSGAADALLSRISSDSRICGGRPCIRGTRMRVADVVEALAHGATREELLRDFDYLAAEDIAAALLYAARASDHRVLQTA